MIAGRMPPDVSTMNGRRPPLSAMIDSMTREAAGYRRPFVVRGGRVWFAYVPTSRTVTISAYHVRVCPTWAEAYAWVCAKTDRCAVCGNPSNDHDGWNHAYASGPGPVAVPRISTECGWRLGLCTGCEKCEPRPDGPLTKAQWRDETATGDTPWYPAPSPCLGYVGPVSPDAVAEPVPMDVPETVNGQCSHCLNPVGSFHAPGCRYERLRP